MKSHTISISVPLSKKKENVSSISIPIAKGILGRIITKYDITAPVITTAESADTRCAGLAIDKKRNRVIVGYELTQNNFEGFHFPSKAAWQPVQEETLLSVAIVAYPSDCKFLC